VVRSRAHANTARSRHGGAWSRGVGSAAGTIRADFARSIDANAVHGSDGPDTARTEIAYFFGDSALA
jgi:nucleoside-diphosphate kinase